MCIDEAQIRHLANEATNWQKMGVKLPGSAGNFSVFVYSISKF